MSVRSLVYVENELWNLGKIFFSPSHNYSSSQWISLCYRLNVKCLPSTEVLNAWSPAAMTSEEGSGNFRRYSIARGRGGGALSIMLIWGTCPSFCFQAAVK